ncbi:MAG: response regulator transcription factor [Parvularcula sp.]|nr:response regulator transcription factor [Parvularcula sp.]
MMRVLLADDHDLVRDAIGSLLRQTDPDIEVVTAENLSASLELCRSEERFDVVIIDLNMPGMDGLSGARRMVEAAKAPVMLMSGQARRADVAAALDLGVAGFVPKTLAGRALINAIRLVASGESYVPTSFLQRDDESQGDLTPRERQVLGQLRHGAPNKEIARILGITETTVKLHLRSIAEKLGAKNRLEIAIKAIDAGLI